MEFFTVTGPKSEFDRVVEEYISHYDIHLEYALSELKDVPDLNPFVEVNPYKEQLALAKEYMQLAHIDTVTTTETTTYEKAKDILTSFSSLIQDTKEEKEKLLPKQKILMNQLQELEPFKQITMSLDALHQFHFVKHHFGRIAHEHYNKFSKFVLENLNTIFIECDSDSQYVWGIYFTPNSLSEKIEAIYSSFHFETIDLSNAFHDTPKEEYAHILSKLDKVNETLQKLEENLSDQFKKHQNEIMLAYHTLEQKNFYFDVRKMAACTKDDQQVYFILCGWIGADEAEDFFSKIKEDSLIFSVIEEDKNKVKSTPPTKLKNPKIFRPFEMFVDMYSLPAYDELDPTLFLSLSYALMFGIMFGDVGQGLLLVIGGFLFYKFKKMDLGAILSLSGICSTIFGFLYGSLFGYEHILPTIWMKPMENIMSTLMLSVGFGVVLIFLAMFLHIINAIKSKNWGSLLFDTNGIAGVVFYAAVISAVLLIFTGKMKQGIGILGVFIGLPLILIGFKEPLSKLVEKQAKILPDNKGMFFVEAFFELFEILLSYITNTISFVRIGAFALSHAGMMEVVLMLGKATSGHPSYLIIILGNLLVMGLEGLIVGIQTLRLEYYEMFSRFYTGNGRKFKSFKKKGEQLS